MSRKRILLLDASPDMAETMSMMFEMSGIETVVASSLQKNRMEDIDSVIVEIDNLTELPLVKRSIDWLPPGTPVIAISRHSAERFREALMKAGFTDFLVKGEPVEWLVPLINRSRCRSELRAAEFATQLNSMEEVSEMLEAIEKEKNASWRGHCLQSWRYELVPQQS